MKLWKLTSLGIHARIKVFFHNGILAQIKVYRNESSPCDKVEYQWRTHACRHAADLFPSNVTSLKNRKQFDKNVNEEVNFIIFEFELEIWIQVQFSNVTTCEARSEYM